MQSAEKKRVYWRRSLRLTVILLVIWFVVTFVASYFTRELNQLTLFGFPLGFYMGAQGAPVVYLLIIWFYAHSMDRLDRDCGVKEFD